MEESCGVEVGLGIGLIVGFFGCFIRKFEFYFFFSVKYLEKICMIRFFFVLYIYIR